MTVTLNLPPEKEASFKAQAQARLTRSSVTCLKDGQVVQPDPGRLPDYQIHAGQRRGQWPSSPEITAAIFERFRKPPTSEC